MNWKIEMENAINKNNRHYKHNYHFLLSDEEKTKFENDRKRMKLSKSRLFRKLIKEEFLLDVELEEFIYEFRKQGGNINQIAYDLNKSINIDENFKDKVLSDLSVIKLNQIKFIDEVRKGK